MKRPPSPKGRLFGLPANVWPYIPVGVTLLIGIILSIAGFFVVQSVEDDRLQANFEQAAGITAAALETGFESKLGVVQSVDRLITSSGGVDRQGFQAFVEDALERNPSIRSLAWVPKVPWSERAEYERAAHDDGLTGFRIYGYEPSTSVPAAPGQASFPIFYIESPADVESTLGLDLASIPQLRAALEAIRDAGVAAGSERVALQEGDQNLSGFLVFQPSYKKSAPHSTREERASNFTGFAFGSFQIDRMVAESLKGHEGVNILVLDTTPGTQSRYLQLHGTDARPAGSPSANLASWEALESKYSGGFHWSTTLDLAGRQWTLLFQPSPAYITTGQTHQDLGVLSGGVLFTLLLTTYVLARSTRSARIEQLAKELRHANRELSRENKERQTAERDLQRVNLTLEQRVEERTGELTQANKRLQVELKERKRAQAESKEAKEAAEKANQAKTEFLANVSHELRTPMIGITGMTDLAMEAELLGEQREYMSAVRSSAGALLSVISDVLDFSKIEAGKLELASVNFDLHDCVAGSIKLMSFGAHSKGLELVWHISRDVPRYLVGDPDRLRQILLNLVGNAIKVHARRGGSPSGSFGFQVRTESDPGLFRIGYGHWNPGLQAANKSLRRLLRPMGPSRGSMAAPGSGSRFLPS